MSSGRWSLVVAQLYTTSLLSLAATPGNAKNRIVFEMPVILTGTVGTNLPTTQGAFEPTDPMGANSQFFVIFVDELNASGTGLVYATYLSGGSQANWVNARLESGALHIAPSPENGASADWSRFAQQRIADEQKQQVLANQIAATRIWTINRKTGDVSYALNGQVSVIDRGRIVTVLNQDRAAVLFGLEMAIQKFGPRIACDGSVEWKRMVTKIAAQQGISVQFTDPEMQYAMRLLQRMANPRQRQQERGGR